MSGSLRFFVIPSEHPDIFGQWKEFCWGILNANVLKSRRLRAKSDYFDLYGDSLGKYAAIQSPEYRRAAIDRMDLSFGMCSGHANERFYELVLAYFTYLSRFYFNLMWHDLDDRQDLLFPFDFEVADAEFFMSFPIAQKITVYLNFPNSRKAGYVLPEHGGVGIAWPYQGSERLLNAAAYEAEYQLQSLTSSELDSTLKVVARFAKTSKQNYSPPIVLGRVALFDYRLGDAVLRKGKHNVFSRLAHGGRNASSDEDVVHRSSPAGQAALQGP